MRSINEYVVRKTLRAVALKSRLRVCHIGRVFSLGNLARGSTHITHATRGQAPGLSQMRDFSGKATSSDVFRPVPAAFLAAAISVRLTMLYTH